MTKSENIRLYYLQDEIDKYESLYGYKISDLISNDTSYLTKYLKDNRNAIEYKSILKEYCCEYYEKFHPENQITIGINPVIVLKEITLAIIISIYNQIKHEKKTNSVFFRGQTDYTWGLCPSIYRGGQKSLVTLDYIDDRYNKTGFTEKYKKYIDSTYKYADYISMSFAQHACSYSPFIDITKEKIIAESFALSNPSKFNDFEYRTSSLITLNVHESMVISNLEEIDKFLNGLEYIVGYPDRKTITIGESYDLYDGFGHAKHFDFSSIKNIIDILTPKYRILDYSNNDRIKYQKGAFIFFYDCLILDNKIFYELNDKIKILKDKIENSKKKAEISKIYKTERGYDQNHLYDPYLIFNE